MEKSYSQIIGIPVVAEGIGKMTTVTDVLIDPKDGKIAAFFVNGGKIIAPIDILFFAANIIIHSPEDIIDAEDLIKAQNVIDGDIRIMKSRVKTKKGDDLGNVYDYFVDTKVFALNKILVYKSFLGLFKGPERIIPARDIIEIKKNLIIVKNKYAKLPEPTEEEKVANLYPDLAS